MQPIDLNPAGWRDIQRSLKDLGLYTGAIDGIAGPKTRAALRKWQTQTGRVVTGEVTERQRADLLGETR
jgi:peptidoglycan hydrolase-like protein with peptidoglycan-binding domain